MFDAGKYTSPMDAIGIYTQRIVSNSIVHHLDMCYFFPSHLLCDFKIRFAFVAMTGNRRYLRLFTVVYDRRFTNSK